MSRFLLSRMLRMCEAPDASSGAAAGTSDDDSEHEGIREEFDAYHNMTVDEMREHFASIESEFASLPPAEAKRANLESGRIAGKTALTLKLKDEWEEADYDTAKRLVRKLRFNAGRKLTLEKDKKPTPYAIALKNRGHDAASFKAPKLKKVREAEVSLNKLISEISDAAIAAFKAAGHMRDENGSELWPWVEDVLVPSNTVIIRCDGEYYTMTFTQNDAGEYVFTAPAVKAQQRITYIDTAGNIIAVREAENKTPVWRCLMLAAGKSKNGVVFPERVVREATSLFEGTPAFNRTDEEHLKEVDAPQLATWRNIEYDPEIVTPLGRGGMVGDMYWKPEVYPAYLDNAIRVALAAGKEPPAPQFSITGSILTAVHDDNLATAFVQARSCDPVSFASAGGKLISIQAAYNHSLTEDDNMKYSPAFLARLRTMISGNEKHNGRLRDVQEGALGDLAMSIVKEEFGPLFEKDTKLEADLLGDEERLAAYLALALEKKGVAAAADPPESNTDPVETQQAVNAILLENYMTKNAANLSEHARTKLTKRFEGHAFKVREVQEAIQAELDHETALLKSHGSGVRVIVDRADNLQRQFNNLLFFNVTDRDKRRSVREAFGDVIDEDPRKLTNRSIRDFFMALTGLPNVNFSRLPRNVREAVDTDLASDVLTNGFNLSVQANYMLSTAFDSWRPLCRIVSSNDFKPKYPIVWGGFSGLAVKSKAGAYPTLSEAGRSKETYTPAIYGGMFDIAEEDIANDDIGLISSYPERLGQYAKRTISSYVHALYTANPTLATDSISLFHTSHNNILTGSPLAAGLNRENFKKLAGYLKAQVFPGSTDKMSTRIAYLVIPEDMDMRDEAFKICTPAAGMANAVPDMVQDERTQYLVNPHMTDVNDWYIFGHPNEVPTLEVAFENGDDMPQLLVADNQTIGTLFSHGVVQMRLRFVYGGGPVSPKGMGKGEVS